MKIKSVLAHPCFHPSWQFGVKQLKTTTTTPKKKKKTGKWWCVWDEDTGKSDFLVLLKALPWSLRCKESLCKAGDPGSIPGLGRYLEKGMATHSMILTWNILWTEEPGGLLSMELQRIGHD